ncbi:MAG TPA: glucoamylase family protein [Candidatus Acidoferrales bacterium]|nr:glucoamylase family protein [Candidatus Acidoferrales bacterium]
MSTARTSPTIFAGAEEPIRAEILSLERLEERAESLAAGHAVAPTGLHDRKLTPRVFENGRVLLECYRNLARAIQQEHTVTPAAEWLVDNFHIVDEQVREIRDDLPPGFYRRLPKLASGEFQGYPRVLAIAWAFISHTDSQIDPSILRRFVLAYQRVQPLTIGELWALAITLRVVLVENLRRLSEKIVATRTARQEADALADSLLGQNGKPRVAPQAALARFEKTPLATAFAVELLQRLRDLDPGVGPALQWLDKRLKEQKTTSDEIVRSEHRQQAAMNVTVRNIITSMRFLSAFDWQVFFESISLVDEILRRDTIHGDSDFMTRDSYRHAIEDLSRRSRHTEIEIARRVVRRTKRVRLPGRNGSRVRAARAADPGYWLIGAGRPDLERELEFRLPWRRRLLRRYMRVMLPIYLGGIATITILVLALPVLRATNARISAAGLALLALLALIPATDLAVALVNRLASDLFGPRMLPRLELKEGIPEQMRTIVVVPALLTNEQEVAELIERLEVHFLANPEGYVHFALLSDWTDAPAESMPLDAELLSAASQGIARLNARYGPAPDGGERFLLYHRKRVWNPGEEKWMGWERKRGKLHDLNHLLRGGEHHFISAEGKPVAAPSQIRYVITLDADTRLPPAAACQLVGTIAHPLNQPEFSAEAGRVIDGYGVVQPRITPSLPASHGGTLFQRIFSGPPGMDPYASAVSDVYQDLFREGSYTGKGVYDLDAFESALAGKVPENALLSHDLFEGTFARAALASNIELFEEYPAHYPTGTARQHRWVRGDWQLLPWILGFRKQSTGPGTRARIPAVARWKMLDNLRRSLSPLAAFSTLIAAWLIPSASPWIWTRFIVLMIAIPALLPFMIGINPRRGVSKRSYIRGIVTDLALSAAQTGLGLAFLAYHAWLMADAILRTLWRTMVTKKHLLEWVTAAQARYAVNLRLGGMYKRMAGGIVLAIAAGIAVSRAGHDSQMAALPFLAAWFASPAIARWVSLPPKPKGVRPLAKTDIETLRSIARRTWGFFEEFAGSKENNLPPDNFQADPKPVVAHRTSPTNLGLYLLSTLSANDFGWIGAIETIERLEATMETMSKLDRCQGHFYNWYDTETLRPLEPRYISTVDSGNLAGHLVAFANGCRNLMEAPICKRAPDGLADALRESLDAMGGLPEASRAQAASRRQLKDSAAGLSAALRLPAATAAETAAWIASAKERSVAFADLAHALGIERGSDVPTELARWANATKECAESHFRDARLLMPWMALGPREITGIRERRSNTALEASTIELFFQTLPTLADAPERCVSVLRQIEKLQGLASLEHSPAAQESAKLASLAQAFTQSRREALSLIQRVCALIDKAEAIFRSMDFGFLYDKTRKLLSIGYRASDGTLDPNCYDMLASEARLASFIAIAKGDVPASHWFRLGRSLTPVGRGSALISWSGSMFEYLMPVLVMRSPEGSVLNHTYNLIVQRQIAYGAAHHVPWGTSESGYNVRDTDFTYQYTSFGVPGLGLKRGLSEDLVIAPYATALAAMIAPRAATRNFARLAEAGAEGEYGFYEALDYTADRIPEGKKVAVVRAFLAHHQGMSLIALGNVVNDGIMQSRFHAEPIVQAAELLLQERTPRDVMVARPRAEEVSVAAHVRESIPPPVYRVTTPHDPAPRTHLLSNGRYSVMLTAAGSGYSRWRDIALTRWREDATRDCWGSYIYLRDIYSNQVWSAGFHPTGAEPESYEACFYEDRADIVRSDRSITTGLTVVVSPEDDAEMRRLAITNRGSRARQIEVTSYFEVCLATQAADIAHPAFSNLFVRTEFAREVSALLASRRGPSESDSPLWLAHVASVQAETLGEMQYETDRARFLGRGHSPSDPVSIVDAAPLSNSTGAVLDPMMSLRYTIQIPPGATRHITFSTLVAPTREAALHLAEKYRDTRAFERLLTLAWTHAQVQLRHLGVTPEEAYVFQKLANAILYADCALRPSSEVLGKTTLDRGALWAQGISGDLPIVLALIGDAEEMGVIRELLRAHEYWRTKQLAVDLVILNERPPSYDQALHESLTGLMRPDDLNGSEEEARALGRVFLLRGDLLPAHTREVLEGCARAVLFARGEGLADQVMRLQRRQATPAVVSKPHAQPSEQISDLSAIPGEAPALEFFNGLGGFSDGGREYVTTLNGGVRTPQPWVNVVANPAFGFLVSESGGGFTWSVNARENQLTPWSNDAVCDPCGEAIYIRDEDTGEVWTPTPSPMRDDNRRYAARHGQGYSRFESESHGIAQDLIQFVPIEDSIKISRLTLRNQSGRARKLSITAYVEWVLGSSRSATAPFLISESDPQTRALFVRNAWFGEFGGRIAFADLAGAQQSWTADRCEFVGRNRSLGSPAGLDPSARLSGAVGGGLDPCAALQTVLKLEPGATAEVAVFLGEAADRTQARALLMRYRAANLEDVLVAVKRHWENALGTVQVSTPDPAMDLLLNRWLLYQTLACRIWARAGFYQVSGAYGFRDQLQDGMALTVARRDVTRAHLLRAAGRQFPEGDVQHWWHPPSGRGLRTRITDDSLWLPYAVNQFIETTGDMSVLDEMVPFLEGETLAEGQMESYFEPRKSGAAVTLFEHCARALDARLGLGAHGLPLMGTGDWNDGMNRVGERGKGESVWLGWFLHTILWEFSKIAELRGESARAQKWRLHVIALKAALEREAWDGEWYRRAYFDDGSPLGSAHARECQIDSIAQTWAVITGAAESARAARAVDSAWDRLVRPAEGLVLLLTPPFRGGAPDPGYIARYVPGVRENGGQYTHAAVWMVCALAALSDGERAAQVFRMLNPISHANSRAGVQRYKAEPYVLAGDVYSEPPHVGRAGWTWYTGSAGWLYRAGLESILGFRLRGMVLRLNPCIPREWPGYSITFRYHSAVYRIRVENPSGVSRGVALMRLDGALHAGPVDIPLADDHSEHEILVVLG